MVILTIHELSKLTRLDDATGTFARFIALVGKPNAYRRRKARKKHMCHECLDNILPGTEYFWVRGCCDGYSYELKLCSTCMSQIDINYFNFLTIDWNAHLPPLTANRWI